MHQYNTNSTFSGHSACMMEGRLVKLTRASRVVAAGSQSQADCIRTNMIKQLVVFHDTLGQIDPSLNYIMSKRVLMGKLYVGMGVWTHGIRDGGRVSLSLVIFHLWWFISSSTISIINHPISIDRRWLTISIGHQAYLKSSWTIAIHHAPWLSMIVHHQASLTIK